MKVNLLSWYEALHITLGSQHLEDVKNPLSFGGFYNFLSLPVWLVDLLHALGLLDFLITLEFFLLLDQGLMLTVEIITYGSTSFSMSPVMISGASSRLGMEQRLASFRINKIWMILITWTSSIVMFLLFELFFCQLIQTFKYLWIINLSISFWTKRWGSPISVYPAIRNWLAFFLLSWAMLIKDWFCELGIFGYQMRFKSALFIEVDRVYLFLSFFS